MQTNEQKTKLKARLTASRDFKSGRTCDPTRYARAGSAYAKWYEDEYKFLVGEFGSGWYPGRLTEVNDHIELIVKQREII